MKNKLKDDIDRKPMSKVVRKRFRFSPKSADLPATRKMLWLVRDELKYEIRSVVSKLDSVVSNMDSVVSKVDSVVSKVDSVVSKVDSVEQNLSAQIARVLVLLEDQHANNKMVLEGHDLLWQRLERIENASD